MMKATELMIGDWVYNTHNRQPEQVFEIMEHMVMLAYNDLYGYDEIEPIPLTSEILEQAGVPSSSIGSICPWKTGITVDERDHAVIVRGYQKERYI